MKCKIGDGLKETLLVIFGIIIFLLVVTFILYIIGYVSLWFGSGVAVAANNPFNYYINSGSVISLIGFIFLMMLYAGYNILLFIKILFTNPRKILNFFYKCD